MDNFYLEEQAKVERANKGGNDITSLLAAYVWLLCALGAVLYVAAGGPIL